MRGPLPFRQGALDTLDGLEYNYTYENGVLTRSSVVAASVLPKVPLSSVDYIYDNSGSLVKKVVFDGENTVTYTTEQGENENTTVSVEINGNTVKSKSETDALGRKIYDELNTGNGFVSHEFSYLAGKETDEHAQNDKLVSGPTTQLVSQITLSGGRTISYEYDAEERITKVIDSVDGVTEYTYDSLGQLLTETKNGELVNRMLYDNYGNILCKNDIDYIYGDVVWRDLLTAVGDKTITYDAQGNPTNYLGKQLIWKKGRQLAWFEGCSFNYNIQGIRTLKRANGIDHHYTLDGTKILKETFDNNTIIPLYDSEENVCGIIYNGTPFYFQKNLQGDIIAITDQNADTVARYSYDAWGVPTIVEDNSACGIAEINPFRYRGYYYDSEIGFYYLQSRYYDPSVGRFLNSDEAEYLGLNREVLDYNSFFYCANNPVMHADFSGYWYYTFVDYKNKDVLPYLKKATGKYFSKWYLSKFNKNLRKLNSYKEEYYYNVNKLGNYSDYINGQKNHPFCDMKFAMAKIGNVGCELIAIYNIMKLLGKFEYFPNIITECHMNGLDFASGHWGVWPKNIYKYFKAHKISYEKVNNFNSWVKKIKEAKKGILSFWNKPITTGLHTVMVTYKDGLFYVYNAKDSESEPKKIETKKELKKFINDSFIIGYIF